jgi:hypothetical protein
MPTAVTRHVAALNDLRTAPAVIFFLKLESVFGAHPNL